MRGGGGDMPAPEGSDKKFAAATQRLQGRSTQGFGGGVSCDDRGQSAPIFHRWHPAAFAAASSPGEGVLGRVGALEEGRPSSTNGHASDSPTVDLEVPDARNNFRRVGFQIPSMTNTS
uniref:Uncharacterized protein n=1 Tax=Leersia perrieri TaxID=77586 RepID=A0A0D9V2I6_9ORYZ